MSKETLRAFIAIELPSEIKDSLGGLQQILKKTGADVKWVKPANMHLTLKFLGQTQVSDLDKIKESLSQVIGKFSVFGATLSKLGAFPSENSPRVIWVNLEDKTDTCESIAKTIEEKMQEFGFKKEKREFKTHLTLGRVRSALNRLKLINEIRSRQDYFLMGTAPEGRCPHMQVSSVSLIKSTLTSGGPIYETLLKINLSAP